MSGKKARFYFVPEKKSSVSSYSKGEKDHFSFFLSMICIFVLGVTSSVFLVSNQTDKNKRELSRQVQSLPDPSVSSREAVKLNPLFVLLKSGKGGQLIKVEVTLQVDHLNVLNEIKQSISKIRDHLVFILSDKNVSIFDDPEKLQFLKEEVVTQLNLFLSEGKIKEVQLKAIILN